MKNKIQPTKEDFEDLLNKVVDILRGEDNILNIILFGSLAREDFSTRHSDIDLYLICKGKKKFEFERKLWREVNNIDKRIQVHLTFEYSELKENGSLLRYNVFKEGKVLFEKFPTIFLSKNFDIIEVFLINMNLSQLQANQKSNFKRSMTNKYRDNVINYLGNQIIIKKEFLQEFYKITKSKNIKIEVKEEFLYRPKQKYDEF